MEGTILWFWLFWNAWMLFQKHIYFKPVNFNNKWLNICLVRIEFMTTGLIVANPATEISGKVQIRHRCVKRVIYKKRSVSYRNCYNIKKGFLYYDRKKIWQEAKRAESSCKYKIYNVPYYGTKHIVKILRSRILM